MSYKKDYYLMNKPLCPSEQTNRQSKVQSRLGKTQHSHPFELAPFSIKRQLPSKKFACSCQIRRDHSSEEEYKPQLVCQIQFL